MVGQDVLDVRAPDGQRIDPVEVVVEPDDGEVDSGELDGEWQSNLTLADDADLRTSVPDHIDESFLCHGWRPCPFQDGSQSR
jgi:hypothetical protein